MTGAVRPRTRPRERRGRRVCAARGPTRAAGAPQVPGVPYVLNIVNFYKSESLYQEGLRPLLYSEAEASAAGKGWHRAGEEVSYVANERRFTKGGRSGQYSTLRFIIAFPHADDTCFLAM